MNKHEVGFSKFVESRQAQRVNSLLDSGKKGREKLINMLPHSIELNHKFAFLILPSEQFPEKIFRKLSDHNAPDICYLISENPDLDAKEIQLREALQDCVGGGYGTFISCIPGKLGYYEFEDKNERYLLRRK